MDLPAPLVAPTTNNAPVVTGHRRCCLNVGSASQLPAVAELDRRGPAEPTLALEGRGSSRYAARPDSPTQGRTTVAGQCRDLTGLRLRTGASIGMARLGGRSEEFGHDLARRSLAVGPREVGAGGTGSPGVDVGITDERGCGRCGVQGSDRLEQPTGVGLGRSTSPEVTITSRCRSMSVPASAARTSTAVMTEVSVTRSDLGPQGQVSQIGGSIADWLGHPAQGWIWVVLRRAQRRELHR